MVEVTQEDHHDAAMLANRICGCSTIKQHKADIAAILEYRQAAFNAGRASVLEELSDMMLEKSDAEHDRGYGREAATYADAAAMIGAYKEAL